MNNKRVRGKNFTDEEALQLLALVAPLNKVIENKQTNAVANQRKAVAWESIKVKYAEAHPLQMRTAQQLSAKYENLKSLARKYAADNKHIVCGTGDKKYITDVVLETVLEIINKKTVYGESTDVETVLPVDNSLSLPKAKEEFNTNDVRSADEVQEIMEMDVVFDNQSTSQQPLKYISHVKKNIVSPKQSLNRIKFLKKRNLVESRIAMYKEKTRLLRLGCEGREKQNKIKDLQIAMLQEELAEKVEGKSLRLAILNEELEGKKLKNQLMRKELCL